MDTGIKYLQQLEWDLRAAARAEERAASEAGAPPGLLRRFPWGSVAAAIIALVLLAGTVGYFANNRYSERGAATPAAGGAIRPGISPRAVHEAAPQPQAWSGLEAPADSSVNQRNALSGQKTTFQYGSSADLSVGSAAQGTSSAAPPGCAKCGQVDLTKIVKDGQMSIVVPKGGFNKGFEAATTIADQLGGFVLSSSITGTTSGTLTLRIPSHQFDEAILKLHDLGKVESETVTGTDVTANYIDLRAHLRILKTDRQVLLGFLAKASGVGDTLSLQSKLDNVQGQIDSLQGRLNVLTNQISESTIKVSLREEGTAAPEPINAEDVRNPSLGTSWHRGVQGFLRVIGGVVVGLGYLVPILAVALVIWFVAKRVRRSRAAS